MRQREADDTLEAGDSRIESNRWEQRYIKTLPIALKVEMSSSHHRLIFSYHQSCLSSTSRMPQIMTKKPTLSSRKATPSDRVTVKLPNLFVSILSEKPGFNKHYEDVGEASAGWVSR
jgi:hypothetical protein